MNAETKTPEKFLRLSELLGAEARAAGGRIGELEDLLVVDKDAAALVTHARVSRPYGRPSLNIPWDKIRGLTRDGLDAQVSAAEVEAFTAPPPSGTIPLKDFVLDKKILDVDEREVEVVYDILLGSRRGALYAVEVDISAFARLSRLGLGWLAKILYRSSADSPQGAERRRERRTVPWGYVQALPVNLGSLKGDLKLKVLKDQLSKIPSVDVADILEELEGGQRLAVFQQLETDHASDALEELNPKFQRDVIAALKKERAAQLIQAMTPGQAADLMAVLPRAQAEEILPLLSARKADKVRRILGEQEARIADFASADFLRFAPETTVAQARELLRKAARERGRDALLYLYVLDAAGKLSGIAALADLILAEDESTLGSIMRSTFVSLPSSGSLKDAAEVFHHYGFRALPVLDDAGAMVGVLPRRDVPGLHATP